MRQTTDITENLVTGEIKVFTASEQELQDVMSCLYRALFGDCDCVCGWTETYGWAPEAGCPLHD